ncbi:MAG: coproporphyrinogen-III oxidase family protein [Planctomycetia bacterium]
MVTDVSHDKTEVGNYFIANYPPFSFWKKENLSAIEDVLNAPPPDPSTPLGLYLHIPFCRKRCKFCYFRVYTDVNAKEIQDYVDALAAEIALLANKPAVAGRTVKFVYFGGGTPSYLSARQLEGLVESLRKNITWDSAREVTFECEPGTLNEGKVHAIKAIGVTRLSLGVENFNDDVLEENGRAHKTGEIFKAWEWIQAAGFKQVNIDLIAGMVGETPENWTANLKKTIEIAPDSVTIYQMELPYNTRYSRDVIEIGKAVPVANWSTKRSWLDEAFDTLQAAGYKVSSGYTLVRENSTPDSAFLYRDSLWRGADLLGTGVASFGHLSGVHYQNIDGLDNYKGMVAEGKLPLGRAMTTTKQERLIREMSLQTKLGWLDAGYFRLKFGVEIFQEFAEPFQDLVKLGMAAVDGDRLTLTREGLLRVDSLLPRFFLPEHRSDRYT